MNNIEIKKLGIYDDSVFIADGVQISGPEDIKLGENVNIWYNSVLRSSGKEIVIGARTNIQDGSVIHIATNGGTYIGSDVTIGHMSLIHGCTIGDSTLIGMGSIIMDDAKIGCECIVGAGSLITQGKEFPDGVLIMGRPAKVVRELSPEERAGIAGEALSYVEMAREEIRKLNNKDDTQCLNYCL